MGLKHVGTWLILARSSGTLGAIRMNTPNGHGKGNYTKIRKFSNTGTDMTYSASNATEITINNSGVYAIS